VKFKRQLIDKLCGDWNAAQGRFDRRIVKVYGYQAEAEIGGKLYQLELFKQADGWRLGVYGILFGKDMHFRTIEEANQGAYNAFADWLFWNGDKILQRQEYEYGHLKDSDESVLSVPE
jgi:hypothetical protein